MSAQDKTLDQYHNLMQMNAATHLLRTARQLGLFEELRKGQRTLPQLSEALSLETTPLHLLLDGLVAIGIIEQYQDDYALSRAAHLLCQYDQDLGDDRWDRLEQRIRGESSRVHHDDQQQYDQLAATQWVHTPAAMQAAEILDIGGEPTGDKPSGNGASSATASEFQILDLGCGSAVWSCAMAHRSETATVTAVDHPGAIEAARATAESIGLSPRMKTVAGDPHEVPLPQDHFDLVILAQRISGLSTAAAEELMERAFAAVKPGGRLAVIDLFRGPTRPNLSECIEALRLQLDTQAGHVRTLEEIQQALRQQGMRNVQFAFIAASKSNLGIAVGEKG